MLLVGAKFSEIVKIGETIEDGLKAGKIAHIAVSPGSSGLLKKKREDVSTISSEGRNTHKIPSFYKGRPRPSQNSHQAGYTQSSYPNATSSYPNSPPPNYDNPSPIYKNPPPPYQIHPPFTKMILLTVPMCSWATENPNQYINSKLQYTKIPQRTTKFHH